MFQDFLDHVKRAKAEGLQHVNHILIFPRLFDGVKDHVKVTCDDKEVTVEQIYSDATIAMIFEKWLAEQRAPIQQVINRLYGAQGKIAR